MKSQSCICCGRRGRIFGSGEPRPRRRQAEHPRHLRRRHRPIEYQRLYPRAGRIPDPEYRQHRVRGHDVHRLLRREQLHRGPLVVHHRSKPAAHGPLEGRRARRARRAAEAGHHHRGSVEGFGYATGQFGKNHLGDKDEYLPTNHGFDEFFGNLYHLNAEEEPERPYWPKDPNDPFVKNFSPRGVLHTSADGKIEDTGPLTKKRMETIDDETTTAAMDFMDRQVAAKKPFFVWMNTTRMHVFTHVRPEYRGKSGMPGNEYADGMWEHDQDVGKLLKKVDDLKIADNTIVVYTTDNGPNMFTWPDAAISPFRSEKDSNWEGAFRVPAMVRWPGHIKPGEISNEMFSGLDWFPTLLAAAGDTTVKDRLLQGWASTPGGMVHKVHLDGYNQLPYLEGKDPSGARHEFYYFDDDGDLVAMRMDNWKMVFCEQRAPGQLEIWANPLTCLRLPKMYNLRMDPYEHADISGSGYDQWRTENVYLVSMAVLKATQFLQTFVDYPPSQHPASFSIEQVRKQVDKAIDAAIEKNPPQ